MKMLKPSPKRGKNAFDLSHRHILGANFGELLPVTCLETVPGDYFEINCADLLRAMPMVTSPFLRAKQHIDFWFVPYTDLWHQFNSFITSKQQPQSSAIKSADFVPHFSIGDFATIYRAATSSDVDICNILWSKGAAKLFNLLGYGDFNYLGSDISGNPLPDANLWRIAAYNYIWYNEYRQNYYDDGSRLLSSGDSPAKLFNFDDLVCSSYANSNINSDLYSYTDRLMAMFQMRYRTWKKDLYTGLMPSTQFGNVSALDFPASSMPFAGTTSDDAGRWSGAGGSISANVAVYTQSTQQLGSQGGGNQYKHDHTLGFSIPAGSFGFDVLQLRQAQAVQIWRENALRSGNRINDNMRGHFGSAPDYQRDHRPTYIGSYDAVLNISDVNSTAQTGTGGNESLGDVAGKGLSSLDSRTLKFNCNDFGVIIGMFSLLPEAEYNATGVSRPNQLVDRYDYFTPEMENLGLEAVSSQTFLTTNVQTAAILGYAPRYIAYKQKVDKVYGEFATSGNLQIWCSPKYDVYQALANNPALSLATLYVNPNIFNVNFVADAATIGEQFLCDFFFDVEAVREMTVLGLPTAG